MATVIGSLVLAAGALFGIWLGAYYAAGRLGSQLDEQARWFSERRDEESKRFDQQLEAESKRLGRQLEHDRRMRDRDELRKVFDEVAGGVVEALDAILDTRVAVPVLGKVLPEGYKESLKEQEERFDNASTARTKIYELSFEVQRLRLRFGSDHPVTQTFNETQRGLLEFLNELDVDEELWTVEQRERVDEKRTQSGRKNTAFIEACREYTDVGSFGNSAPAG